MIIAAFVYVFYHIVEALVSILPSGGSLPASVTSTFQTLYAMLWGFDFIIPIGDLLICLGIALAWEAFLFIWGLIHWVLKKIPFLGIR